MPERTFDIWANSDEHAAIEPLLKAVENVLAPHANAYGGTNENANGLRLWADWDADLDSTVGVIVADLFDGIAKVLEYMGIPYDDEQGPTTDEDDPETEEALAALADDIENGVDLNCLYCGASIRVPWAMRDNPMCEECEADEKRARSPRPGDLDRRPGATGELTAEDLGATFDPDDLD